ncbi:ferredoxin [Candidatus Micrarchaeota archaeon]|nr:MAG: ferredoxin [Candidatus Micrarchaeota archaeon]
MIKVDREKCIYCGGCVSVCPVNALTLLETRIDCDAKKCINCGICERFCPVGAIKVIKGGENADS